MSADLTEMVWDLMGGFKDDEIHRDFQAAHESGALQISELDQLLQRCDDYECITCGAIMCPYGEPLHNHHDGCPACD